MIVLDEQLLGRGIESAIRRWHRGSVVFINDLRPGSIIKDESVPVLLAAEKLPAFVTINISDFWERVSPSDRYCIVCVALPDSRTAEIPGLIRRLFRHSGFRTKQLRRGKVVRISGNGTAIYYDRTDMEQRTIIL